MSSTLEKSKNRKFLSRVKWGNKLDCNTTFRRGTTHASLGASLIMKCQDHVHDPWRSDTKDSSTPTPVERRKDRNAFVSPPHAPHGLHITKDLCSLGFLSLPGAQPVMFALQLSSEKHNLCLARPTPTTIRSILRALAAPTPPQRLIPRPCVATKTGNCFQSCHRPAVLPTLFKRALGAPTRYYRSPAKMKKQTASRCSFTRTACCSLHGPA